MHARSPAKKGDMFEINWKMVRGINLTVAVTAMKAATLARLRTMRGMIMSRLTDVIGFWRKIARHMIESIEEGSVRRKLISATVASCLSCKSLKADYIRV